MKGKGKPWWVWALVVYVLTSLVGLATRIMDLPIVLSAALGYATIAVIGAFWLRSRYAQLAPVRARANEWASDGTLVIPIALDPLSAPVGSPVVAEHIVALALASNSGFEIRNVDGESLFSSSWSVVAEVRFGHSSRWTPNITVIVEDGIADQEWWLAPINSVGLARRSDPVFGLIDQMLDLRDSAIACSAA